MQRLRLLLYVAFPLLFAGIAGAALDRFAPGGFLPLAGSATRPQEPAAGLFLVASHGMSDPHFSHAVVYLVSHDEQGSLGLVVNRPSPIRLADAVSGVEGGEADDHAIYFGGPVKHSMITMLIRSEKEVPLVHQVADGIFFSNDRRVLDRLLAEHKPANSLRFYMGHAGWVAGQLQRELDRGDWRLIEADPASIFSSRPESLWQRLLEKVDPSGFYVGPVPQQAVLTGAG